MKRLPLYIASATLIASLSACGSGGELEKFDVPETLSDTQITKDATDITELGALSKINPYSIDPNFIANNLGSNRFGSMKEYVDRAVEAANDTGDLTKQEVELWHQIVSQESFSLNLVSDTSEKITEIDVAMKEYADASHYTIPEILEQYGMNLQSYQEFSKKQAEKFVIN